MPAPRFRPYPARPCPRPPTQALRSRPRLAAPASRVGRRRRARLAPACCAHARIGRRRGFALARACRPRVRVGRRRRFTLARACRAHARVGRRRRLALARACCARLPVGRRAAARTQRPRVRAGWPACDRCGRGGRRLVRVAIIDGSDKAWETIEKGREPLTRSAAVEGADLVWDVGKSEALSRGDLVMQFVDGSLIGGVVDRTWMLKRLREIAENRYLSMQLASGGQLLTAGDVAKIEIGEIAGQRLVVFNIAADATVQMLYPSAPGAAGHCKDPQNDAWSCSLRVTPPLGADTIVALTTSGSANDLLLRLREHHGRRDAALVPDLLTDAMKTDPSARIGFVGVYTNKHQ